MDDLRDRHCEAPETFSGPLALTECERAMSQLHPDWSLDSTSGRLFRELRFGNYHETMAFVNAVAWIAHREDHHPDLEVHYNRCIVRFSTHAVGGISLNDFVCAARVDALFD